MFIAEIWRYPVKSMAGERVVAAGVTPLGITGDRIIQVVNARGRVVTSRTHPRLVGHHATLDKNGMQLIDSRPWTDPSILEDVRRIVGPGAQLVHDESVDRFDVLPLLVATVSAISAAHA